MNDWNQYSTVAQESPFADEAAREWTDELEIERELDPVKEWSDEWELEDEPQPESEWEVEPEDEPELAWEAEPDERELEPEVEQEVEQEVEWEHDDRGGTTPSAPDQIVRLAIAGGLRDENKLTNLVFFARHPERQGRKLSPDEPGFAALGVEWRRIRDTIVIPALGRHGGPLAAVATPLPFGATRNRFGIPETIEALTRIRDEWARRHPDVRFEVRDISQRGGGRLRPHKSHRIGLDADVNLQMNGRRIGVRNADYERQRPLVQELVDLIRANKVLPVMTIGFLDPKVRGVSPWPGHTKHLHIRFCRPDRYAADLDLVYAPGEAKPRYDCAAGRPREVGHLDFYYEDEDDEEAAAETEVMASNGDVEELSTEPFAAFAVEQASVSGHEAEGFLEPFRRLAQPFARAIKVVRALRAGTRSEKDLTDLVFFDIHPTRRGQVLTADETAEWTQLRDRLVRPLLWGQVRVSAVERARSEWQRWRQGTLVENHADAQGWLHDYWAATPHMPTGPLWHESWSAAFISFLLREAGAGTSFRYHNAHRVYVHWAIRNATHDPTNVIKAFPVTGADRIKPRVGDLVCTWRGRPVTYAGLAAMAQPPAPGQPGRALHCDIVTEVARDHIKVVGGNKQPTPPAVCPVNPLPPPDGCTAAQAAARRCGCTVNRARHPLDADGFLAANPRWVAIVRIGP
jgi:Uncharacterized protein conserved in bacteria (DUF2272)/Penicillin-insensitive murein endopeptidase